MDEGNPPLSTASNQSVQTYLSPTFPCSKRLVKSDAWSLVLEGQKSAKYVSVPCSAARAPGVADACAFVEACQGKLLKAPPAGFVWAFLSAPAEFVEPEAPSGALGPVAGFSALEVPVHIESPRDRI